MLTNNWKNLMSKCLNKPLKAKSWSGTEASLSTTTNYAYCHRFYIGTGTTPEKKSDYCMEAIIDDANYVSSLEIIANADTYENESGLFVSGTVTNMSAESLTVSEIGYSAAKASSNAEDQRYLLAREVLKEPIEIPSWGGTVFRIRTCIENFVALLANLFAKKGGVCYAD